MKTTTSAQVRTPATIMVMAVFCVQLLAAVTMACCFPDQENASTGSSHSEMAAMDQHHDHQMMDSALPDTSIQTHDHSQHDSHQCVFCAMSHHGNPLAYQPAQITASESHLKAFSYQDPALFAHPSTPWRPPA